MTATSPPLPLEDGPRAGALGELPVDAMLARLLAEPESFEFFQAVRLLERLRPERSLVGEFSDPAAEAVHFRAANTVSFPSSEIEALTAPFEGPARMTVNFFGLTGPQGILPLAYSLYGRARARERDHALREFLAIFDHRMLSLLYRAWEKSRAAMALERSRNSGNAEGADGRSRDWLTRHLLDVVGLGTGGLQDRLPIADATLLYYAGLLALPSRPAAALEQMLADYFHVPVEVEQFVGAWYPLDRAAQSALGDAGATLQLGAGAVAGDEVWDQQGRVRIRIGPLARARYQHFLPGGEGHEPLRALTRFFCNDQLDVEIQLVLARDEVPSCRLGDDDAAALPLGWCTWLKTAPLERDPDDALFTL
jgi:type VI secretion system protein ImpH